MERPASKFSSVRNEGWSTFSLDLIKFLVSGLGFGFVLLGYSYTHTFFRSFGVSLFDLEMSPIDLIYRGIALVLDIELILYFAPAVFISALLLALRSHVSQLFGMLGAVISLVILTPGVLLIGMSTGGKARQDNLGGRKRENDILPISCSRG